MLCHSAIVCMQNVSWRICNHHMYDLNYFFWLVKVLHKCCWVLQGNTCMHSQKSKPARKPEQQITNLHLNFRDHDTLRYIKPYFCVFQRCSIFPVLLSKSKQSLMNVHSSCVIIAGYPERGKTWWQGGTAGVQASGAQCAPHKGVRQESLWTPEHGSERRGGGCLPKGEKRHAV